MQMTMMMLAMILMTVVLTGYVCKGPRMKLLILNL